jgi:acyl carrier protein
MSEKLYVLLRNAVRESSLLGADLEFEDSTPILPAGIIDSMGIFGIVTELERAFDFKLPPEELVAENFKSIDAMAAMVRRLIEKGTIATP